jgi:imidazolonepropionase-like amidohydrolase
LLECVLYAAKCGALSLAESFRCAGENPARLLKIPEMTGTLEPGDPADFLVYKLTGDKPVVEKVVIKGTECYSRK